MEPQKMHCKGTAHYLVISVFPEIESYELKGRQHGPAKVIKSYIAKSRVFSNVLQAGVAAGADSGEAENKMVSNFIVLALSN